ncbi:unnamed protein product [Clonostachys rosea f. rosea IK726]|uniref:Uncharacterized protein n=1 Tax=Clonostachys rosea f. rosea IK726 TaxID=1349383 RepID=A0ACA9T6H4_BIOOC|nr:unnamed protein product [Clonostachys rosea f. rosea IK726]
MPAPRAILQQVADDFVANLNNFTSGEAWSNGRTPDAIHNIHPLSLAMPPNMNNDAMAKFLGGTLAKVHNLTVQPVENTTILIDEQNHKISLHLLGKGDTPAGPFTMEYIFTLKTTDDGKLVRESWEFVDSLTATQMAKSGKE